MVGALERTSTFVTNYAIDPFVGLLDGTHWWRASELEVDVVLSRPCEMFGGQNANEHERRGIAFETDASCSTNQLVWGATRASSRVSLERVGRLIDRRANE